MVLLTDDYDSTPIQTVNRVKRIAIKHQDFKSVEKLVNRENEILEAKNHAKSR